MTSESTLHRWALLDKSGKTRNTCTTSGKANATYAFKEVRKNRAIPKGWTIVDRGPVYESVQRAADAFHEAIEKARPRTFQVGDRVRYQKGSSHICKTTFDGTVPYGTPGTIKREENSPGWFGVQWDGHPYKGPRDTPFEVYEISELELVEPAPQPKAEDRCVDCRDFASNIEGWVKDLGGDPDQEALSFEMEECISRTKAEIATLKAEVERLNHSLADTRSEMMENYHQFSQARDRAEAAEAKLADIAAIARTTYLLLENDARVEIAPVMLQAMQSVLDR